MATPMYSSKLSGSKFKNWIKAGLGVLYTKEGIEPFVCDEIEQFQQKCLNDICINNGLPAGTTCSGCCTENVIVCPTNRICNAKRGKCSFHRNSATQYLPSGCPNKICHNFKNEIQNAHRFCGPSYKNTDASQWCSNAWEVAKCFMPPDGYKDVTNAAKTDFNGINSVIINFKAFQSKVKDDLSKKFNIFEQGREVGRAVRHSPQLEMEDTDLHKYFTDLQNLLSDPTYLSANTDAQNAKTKLLQLQNDTLIIGKDDIRNVLDDVAKAVQDKIRTEIDEQKKEAEKTKLELISITNASVKRIESQEILSISQLDKALDSAINDLEKHTKASLKKVQSEADIAKKQIGECADKGVSKLNVEADTGVKQIEISADKGVSKLKVEADTGVKQIEISADKGVSKLKVEADTGVKQIEKQIEISADKGVSKLKVEAEAGATKISAKADEALKKIEESTTANKEDKYNKLKEGKCIFV
ncbi:uncharacterized protein LOC128553181 [Mercenaria mercenaria]|uniref:uncharacterized protein LOC128553181 n=1 Tax=Mercenaria mercenaria TaxID=6596 RepID=UPI00234EDE4A|nr:uncharacterized protein LOC128553181 [Mercenaria mercenaria]